MTLNEYRIENKLTFEQFAKQIGFKGKNPATLAVRICLQGSKKYFKLPSTDRMIFIQDTLTKGKVKIEDMVREYDKAKK